MGDYYDSPKAACNDCGHGCGFLPGRARPLSPYPAVHMGPLQQAAIHVFLLLFCLNFEFYSVDCLLSELLEFVPLHFLLNF
ncbi:hypothetical protein D3C72_1730150 [compost metagenome]